MILKACLGLGTGSYILLETSPFEIAQNISKLFQKKKQSLKNKIRDVTVTKKKKGIKKLVEEIKEILKVELKTTIRPSNIEIHLSRNELERIIYFIDKKVDNWQIWLNSKNNNITKLVKDEVSEFRKQKSSFYTKDYILKIGIKE